MLVETIIKHLTAKLGGVQVSGEAPAPDIGWACEVIKSGGGERNLVRQSLIIVRSYGTSRYQAAILNERVIKAMHSITDCDDVTSCELNTEYDATDPVTMRYRYNAVFNITHYEEV